MSQITHSQLALKKRNTPVSVSETVADSQKANRKSNGLNEAANNGQHKNDKDIILIDDDYNVIPIAREEIVEEEPVGGKKKRNRRSKNSSDSRESSELVIRKAEEVTPKQNKSQLSATEKSPEEVAAPNVVEDFPTPEASPKVGKLTAEALLSKQRRSDRLQNASTIVNLSTVSTMDQSTKVSGDTLIVDETPGERRVSGRRSTRPIDDIKYEYRTPNPDDSLNATTNATIGSEIGDSILTTPATDRKRRIDSEENIDSPKRSRLDLSALFNNFYSPVSILRNKFKRTNLASTPKAGGLLDDSTVSLDGSANELKEVDLHEEKIDENTDTASNEDDVKIIVKPIKKTSCSIM